MWCCRVMPLVRLKASACIGSCWFADVARIRFSLSKTIPKRVVWVTPAESDVE